MSIIAKNKITKPLQQFPFIITVYRQKDYQLTYPYVLEA